MKKALIVLLIAMSAVSLNARSRTKSFNIQGGYGDILEILVEPIASQTQAYLIGMPFNIEDNQVQYGKTESGRMIATWNILTNRMDGDIRLKVSGAKLKHSNQPSSELDYELRFFYRLGYYNTDGDLVDTGANEALMYSTDPDGSAQPKEGFTLFSSSTAVELGSYIGSIDGSIYFMFTEDSSAVIRPTDGSKANYTPSGSQPYFPGGEYSAEVTLTLEVGE